MPYVHSNFSQFCNSMLDRLLVIFLFAQIQSPSLCNLIGGENFVRVARLQEPEIRLFQCFLDTRLMISRPENPNPLRADEEVLELVPGGGHRRKRPRKNIKTVDPLHQLFLQDDHKHTGIDLF